MLDRTRRSSRTLARWLFAATLAMALAGAWVAVDAVDAGPSLPPRVLPG